MLKSLACADFANLCPQAEDNRVVGQLLRMLEQEGVRYLFGVPGGAIVPLYEALSRGRAIQPILAKHEEGAAFMADGYARVSRTLGVCCATTGPGATNALTGVAGALADSIPMLLLSGQISTAVFGRGALQDSTRFGTDVVELFRPVTKLSTLIVDPASAPRIFQRAIRTALSGRPGPVHLSLPSNIITQPAPEPLGAGPCQLSSRPIDLQSIRAAAALLRTAERPGILAGHGVNVSGAWEELLRFADNHSIPVATTPKAKGVLPEDHPLSLGVFGFGGHPLAQEYLLRQGVDVLLVAGSSLGEFQTNSWDPRLGTGRIIQIDIDPTEIGKNYPVDVGVVGDVRAALAALDGEMADARSGRRINLDRLRRQIPRVYHAEQMASEARPLKPQRLVQGMRRVLPDEALLFMDNGNCMSWFMHYYEVRRPGVFFTNQGLSCMGYSVPAAIGASLAAPDRPVVAIVGDGAFAMNGLEVHTAVELQLPVIWVVLNDGGFGMVEQGDTLVAGRPVCPSRYRHTMDIAMLARSLGATGICVDAADAFEDALRTALALRGPCVVEARIDPREVPASLRVRTEGLQRMFGARADRGGIGAP